MEIDVEKFAEEQGKKIADAIVSKYDEHSYSFEAAKVEKEIYDRALHEATAFFLKNGNAKFDDKILDVLRFRLRTRLEKSKGIEKLTPEELLGNVVKIEATDVLLEAKIILS